MPECPLCSDKGPRVFATTTPQKVFWGCGQCDLVFLDPKAHLTPVAEKSRYQTHNNDIRQEGYRKFLNQMWQPLKDKGLDRGLDFGCGPTMAFAELAAESGVEVTSYDPYFFPADESLKSTYPFVWCSEVFEHFNAPKKELPLLRSLLRPGGVLAVMTSAYPTDPDRFKNWGYHNDPTHISFYSPRTMQWIAANFDMKLEPISERVNFFIAPGP